MSPENTSLRSIVMEARSCLVLILLVMQIVFSGQWITSAQEKPPTRKLRKSTNENPNIYQPNNPETKRRVAAPNTRDLRKKPSGHLTALKADDMDNDSVVSVAVGPAPVRPKYDKAIWKHLSKNNTTPSTKIPNNNAINFVKDVLTQLGREFLTHQVNEDFVFGQYVGNSMKNFTRDIRLKMQHEILDIIVKYQKINNGDVDKDSKSREEDKNSIIELNEVKTDKKAVGAGNNETEEPWPDFSNLAKIVG